MNSNDQLSASETYVDLSFVTQKEVLDPEKFEKSTEQEVKRLETIVETESDFAQRDQKYHIAKIDHLKQELADVQSVINNMTSALPPILDSKENTETYPLNSSDQVSENFAYAPAQMSASGTSVDLSLITQQGVLDPEIIEKSTEQEVKRLKLE